MTSDHATLGSGLGSRLGEVDMLRAASGTAVDDASALDWLADRGILAAPGDFYGPAGEQFVRIGLNGTDERIAAAVARLAE